MNLSFKKVLKINIILASLYLVYLVIEFIIWILIIKGKIHITNYLPLFLVKWLKKKEEISKVSPEALPILMDLFAKDLLSHIGGLLILIIFFIML